MPNRGRGGFLFVIGFILSPLSWWNDALVNIPVAYVLAIPFTLISEKLFLPVFVLGYWVTNVAGFILMHIGANDFVKVKTDTYSTKRVVIISLLYTLGLIALVSLGWIKPISELSLTAR